MDWQAFLKKHHRAIIAWCIILMIAPFFIEIIIVADVLGAEVAVSFFVLLFNDYKNRFILKLHQAKEIFKTLCLIIQQHPIAQGHIYGFHLVMSVACVLMTGSVIYATAVWYPILILGQQSP
ncbi:hypothetical protein [Parendozoicomonas haliclonae]|uniref:Uncharacterized protein n=1 Tax=Parendozoicomonas haliclonae TaxID=1960125 RepID=A0A1X7ARB4_9GAMM|nr:hypothetical protein [Parendozoicomonas haliclonae]SMA50682.1 hypothetical protein EHSB41UT_04499 [Parendozoicomonas haliclonae]